MTKLALIPLLFALSSCSVLRALDFGGDPDKPFEFRLGWDKGVEKSGAKPGKTDDNGVYQPEVPEAEAALSFPDVSAGIVVEVRSKPRVTPTVQLDLFDFKLPYIRWFSCQAGMGYQLGNVYLGKRLVSILELTVGGWMGYDFETHSLAWGLGGTLIKF
jgi:hypothetical protein